MKKTFLAVCILVICMVGNSWAGMVTDIWSEVYNSGKDHSDLVNSTPTKMFDYVSEVAIDSSSNIVVAGRKAGDANHGYNAYARKYDLEGGLVCEIEVDSGVIGGAGGVASSDTFYAVAVDSQDNIILVGTLSGVWPPAHQRLYVNKYDPDCVPVWGQAVSYIYNQGCYGCSAWQSASDVTVDRNTDSIYVSGTVFGAWDNTTEQEWAILKYDKDGNLQPGFPWLYNYSNQHYIPDSAYGIALDSAGNIIVVGARGVSGTEGGTTNNLDWHVRKYDPTGILIWEDTYDGASNLADTAYKVAVDSNDDVIVAGYTNIGTDNTSNANYDWLVIKYSRNGDAGTGHRLWTYTHESALGRSEACYAVAVNDSDDVWVGGNQLNTSESPAVANKRLVLLSGTDGNLAGEKIWTASNIQSIIGLDARGDVVVTGSNLYDGTYYDFETSVFSSAAFGDVPWGFWAEDYIRSIYYYGITTGCTETPLNYCPSNNVTRQAMAAFIIRSLYGEDFTYPAEPYFTDVPDTHFFFKYIQKMREQNITTGCTATEYCPGNNVTRQAMAAFIIRALFGETFDYTLSPFFTDVPDTSQFFKYVQKMKDEGITTGCTATEYCPGNNVTRQAMAAFLARAFLGVP